MKRIKYILLLGLLAACHLVVAQDAIDLRDQIPDPNGNMLESGMNAFHDATIIYDGHYVMLLERDGKYGAYEKETKQKIPIIFEKMDRYLPEDNLLKYNGQWGELKDGIFNVLEDPVYIKPDRAAFAKTCMNEYHYKNPQKHACEKQKIKQIVKDWFKDRYDSLTGLVSIQISVSKNAEISPGRMNDSTNYLIAEELIEMIFQNMPDWEPAIVDGNRVNSLVSLYINFDE